MISKGQTILLAILLGGCTRTQVPHHTLRVTGGAVDLTIAFGSTNETLRVAFDNNGKDIIIYEGADAPLFLEVGSDGGCNGIETPHGFVEMVGRYVDVDTGKTNIPKAFASLDGTTNALISIWRSLGSYDPRFRLRHEQQPKAQSTNAQTTVFVRDFMQLFSYGEIKPPPGHAAREVRAVSGWVMTTERDMKFPRWQLNDQADYLIPLGVDAVPELIRWLDHSQMEVRYVAAYSLRKITGKDPYFPTFATLQDLKEKGLLRDATSAWKLWYEEHHRTEINEESQPATPPYSVSAASSPQQ